MIWSLGAAVGLLGALDLSLEHLAASGDLLIWTSLIQILLLGALVYQDWNDLTENGEVDFFIESKIPTDLLATAPGRSSPSRGFTFGQPLLEDDESEDILCSYGSGDENDDTPSCCLWHAIKSVMKGIICMIKSGIQCLADCRLIFTIRLWIKKAPNIKYLFVLGVSDLILYLGCRSYPEILPYVSIIVSVTIPLTALTGFARVEQPHTLRRRKSTSSKHKYRPDDSMHYPTGHSAASFIIILVCNCLSACLIPGSPFVSGSTQLPLLSIFFPGSPFSILDIDDAFIKHIRKVTKRSNYVVITSALSLLATYSICVREMLSARYRQNQLTLSWGDPSSLVTTVREVLPPPAVRKKALDKRQPRVHFTQKEQQLSISLLASSTTATSVLGYILLYIYVSPSIPSFDLGPGADEALQCLRAPTLDCFGSTTSLLGVMLSPFAVVLVSSGIVRRQWGSLGIAIVMIMWQHLGTSPRSLVGLLLSTISLSMYVIKYCRVSVVKDDTSSIQAEEPSAPFSSILSLEARKISYVDC